jgi:hypothetical protein
MFLELNSGHGLLIVPIHVYQYSVSLLTVSTIWPHVPVAGHCHQTPHYKEHKQACVAHSIIQ